VGRPLHDYERCTIAEIMATNIMKQYPWYTIKTAGIQITKTCCSLYTAQALLSDAYQWPHYTKDTSLWTKIKRFLLPQVRHNILIPIVYWEIIMFIFLVLGFIFFVELHCVIRKSYVLHVPRFPTYFFLLSLRWVMDAPRLRFPIEPLIIIFSGVGWLWMYGLTWSKKSIF
jgi:hypothetical protein